MTSSATREQLWKKNVKKVPSSAFSSFLGSVQRRRRAEFGPDSSDGTLGFLICADCFSSFILSLISEFRFFYSFPKFYHVRFFNAFLCFFLLNHFFSITPDFKSVLKFTWKNTEFLFPTKTSAADFCFIFKEFEQNKRGSCGVFDLF